MSSDSNIKISMKPFQDLYQAKDWSKAVQWLETHKINIGEGLYHFNMGVLSLKLEQLPMARYYFEQARLNGINDPWLYRNIDSVKQDLGVNLVESPSFFEQAKIKVLSYVSVDYITAGVLIIFLAFLLYWIKNKLIKNFYTLATLAIVSIALMFIVLTVSDNKIQVGKLNQAIVLEQVSIYEGPSAIFEELGKLPAGLKIKWDESNHGWAKISDPINFRGWIQLENKALKELN